MGGGQTEANHDAPTAELIEQVRRGNTAALGRLLDLYRNYLKFLAQLHADDYLQAKADPSDLVQDACLQAHRDLASFRGTTEREFIAWLRQILAAQNAMFHRRYATQRRDVHLERRLQEDLDQSSAVLQAMAVSAVTTPSDDAARRERAALVADALMELPVLHREVMILHHFKNLTMPEVAAKMGRTVNSVQKLWSRAVNELRRSMVGRAMNANRNERREASAVAAATATMDTDARVVRALDELRSAIDGGENVDREMLLAKYHDIAEPLGKCLDALEVVDGMAPQMAAAVDSERSDMLWLSDDHHIPARFGDYRLVRQIGGGGMGIVFEAEQVSLGRRVALKVLPFAAMLDQKCCQRFHNEARAAATLDHPNIVAVFAVGLERGVHYYAMQLISGQSMDRLIAELRLIGRAESNRGGCSNTFGSTNTTALKTPVAVTGDAKRPPDADLLSGQGNCGQANDSCPVDGMPRRLGITSETDLHSPRFFRQVARWGIEAAKAVDHAHENGVVHRDIKPGNLLVDTSGKLWVTDFGLARLERDNGLTMTGDLIGTARYMSPEQAHGGHAVIDHRTDIYSLGVTLHEMLTLQPAFAARDRQALLRQIATVDPRPLRRIKKSVPADLETIVLKATNKEPRDTVCISAGGG